MNSLKFIRYLKHKLPEIKLYEFYSDLCVPGKSYQEFYEKIRDEMELIRFEDISIQQQDSRVKIIYKKLSGKEESLEVDMMIVSPSVVPSRGASELAEVLGIPQKHEGFYGAESAGLSPVNSGREGIYIAGCVEGPKDIAESIAQADAAAGRVLSSILNYKS